MVCGLKSITDLTALANTGAKIIISAEDISMADIMQLCWYSKLKEGHIVIKKASVLSMQELLNISTAFSNNVTFDMSGL